jgi:crotonobetainyl-CoA:carnitine CoA-transferase CaiB-like acyl-CoA transferase
VEREQMGLVRQRNGNRASYTAPSNVYCSADGQHFTLVASSDAIFKRLCEGMGESGLAQDKRFGTNTARIKNNLALDDLLEQWFAKRSYDEIARALSATDVPFSKAYSIDDILADQHFQAREAIIRLPDDELGSVPAPCVVPRVVGRAPITPNSGPRIGQHNAEIYGALGIDDQALAQLREQKIV